ncbi:MAG: YfhO family protein [Planctomycetota bacterium]|nr:MAG: YfhO family protein [Planctomycetota bacterium]
MDDIQPTDLKPIAISPRYRRLLVSSLIVVLPVVILVGAWRLGGASAIEDDLIYYLPIRQYIGQQIRAGDFPLWNPLVGMGTSIAADPQSGLWYPPTYLFALLPPLLAYPVTIILHFALAGGGMYRFLRACRHDWRAALLGAIAFEFCGYLVAHRAHLTIHHAAAWVPWIFYAWRRFADTGRYHYFVLASLCLGLQMLVQHIQISIITCALLAGYVIFVLRPRRRGLWWQFPAGLLLGVMVSAVQLLPTWFYLTECGRGVPAYYLFVENSWKPWSGLMFIFPMLFGSRTPNLWEQPWWGLSHFCEQSAYGSIMILMLAASSLYLIRRYREVGFWWAASLVALVIALGDLTPISKLLFHVPLYRNLRVPARWILIWSMAMPILATTVVSVALQGRAEIDRIRRGIVFSRKLIMVLTIVGLVLMLIARLNVERLAGKYTDEYFRPVFEGLRSAIYLGNPAIWWPILLVLLSALLVSYWIKQRGRFLFISMFVLFLVDLASVAGFVDVDTRIYARSDIQDPPPLAEAIKILDPRPGDRLLVPRFSANYQDPIEILWPQTNARHGIATFNGYGPFWPMANRMLFRFMPWGSSEDILSLLRNGRLMRSMGIRFVAVRSDEEKALLEAAMHPSFDESKVKPIHGTEQPQPVQAGEDLLWPIKIDAAGVYELSFDADPLAGSPSRWFVRLENAEGEQIDETRTMGPVDLAMGPRRLRFLFVCDEPISQAYVRIKSEMGQALSVRGGQFGQVTAPPKPNVVASRLDGNALFSHHADLPGGISLYEIRGTVDLVRWADRIEPVYDLLSAVECLQARTTTIGSPESAVVECAADWEAIPPVGQGVVSYNRVSGNDLCVQVDASTEGFIVFNESYDPGWRATIDGKYVDICRVNAVCQGVFLPAGGHQVRFLYYPRGIVIGSGITGLAILIIAGIFFATWRRNQTYKTMNGYL